MLINYHKLINGCMSSDMVPILDRTWNHNGTIHIRGHWFNSEISEAEFPPVWVAATRNI